MTGRFLVVDDEKSLRSTFMSILTEAGYEAEAAEDYDKALEVITRRDYDVIIADIMLGGQSGLDLLRAFRGRHISIPVIMVTGFPNVETASEAVRLGAYDYIAKPVLKKDLLQVARSALKYRQVEKQNEAHQANIEAIFRSVQDAIITINSEGRIIAFNKAAESHCGIPADAVGQTFRSLNLPCSGVCREILASATHSRQPAKIDRRECRRPDQPRQVVTLTTSPLVCKEGDFRGTVLVVRDETRLDDLERRLQSRCRFHNMIGKSEKMHVLYSLLEDLAEVDTAVLIYGESGTGKELVADALHNMGGRRKKPLVKVNCAALSDSLLESELFGHVKGAFTGAIKERVGRFEKADSGTIFLDEIGDISPKMQLRLLRVLQEKEFERVGESTPIKVDVRIIAATNRDLAVKVQRGEFREDLYYRLKVFTITLPSLRERKEDIPLLVRHLLDDLCCSMKKEITVTSAEVVERLVNYSWPGNIRELRHVLEYALVRCRGPIILPEHLPPDFSSPEINTTDEREAILSALAATAGNKARAARLLRMDRKTLYRKIEKYRI